MEYLRSGDKIYGLYSVIISYWNQFLGSNFKLCCDILFTTYSLSRQSHKLSKSFAVGLSLNNHK